MLTWTATSPTSGSVTREIGAALAQPSMAVKGGMQADGAQGWPAADAARLCLVGPGRRFGVDEPLWGAHGALLHEPVEDRLGHVGFESETCSVGAGPGSRAATSPRSMRTPTLERAYSQVLSTGPGSGKKGAARLVRAEAEALLAAADRLDEIAFAAATDIMARCKGKVVTIGVGTSGIIARKIAATMTSTGMPAVFLHPNDALHGALGAVSGDDVVVVISNSGETAELLGLLPYLRHRAVPVIGILGRTSSALARAADVVLDAGAEREICPFNLAPTSSTTTALAIGDALAVALYEERGLTPEQFALNHPSGALGRRLTLRVADVMHRGDDLPAVGPAARWTDVLACLTDGGLGAVVVLGDAQTLLGIVTDGDVRRTVQRLGDGGLSLLVAADLMTSHPTVVGYDVLVYDALQQMEDRPSQISVLPVVDGATCVGVVRVHDLVRAGV